MIIAGRFIIHAFWKSCMKLYEIDTFSYNSSWTFKCTNEIMFSNNYENIFTYVLIITCECLIFKIVDRWNHAASETGGNFHDWSDTKVKSLVVGRRSTFVYAIAR